MMMNYLAEMGQEIINNMPAPADAVRFIMFIIIVLISYTAGYTSCSNKNTKQNTEEKHKFTKKEQYQIGKMIREVKKITKDELMKMEG